MWSVPYLESPAPGSNNETIAQCCAFQRLGNIPQGEPHPKAPHYRFLCWVMLFRTLDLSIDKRERLTCPLSSCEETFGDQQYLELVNHVSSCTYLERGLYDCPYCHKEESFCWELSYTIDERAEDSTSTSATSPHLVETDNAHPPVQSNTPPSMNANNPAGEADQNHLFSNQFAEFERDTFPEVFISTEGRPSHSPTQAISDGKKRKYSEFDDGPMESSFAEFSNDTLPERTAAYSPYHHYMPAMTFELPTSNVAGHSNSHLSTRASPEGLQRSSPQLMQQALEMNLDPFPMGMPLSPGFGENPNMARSNNALQSVPMQHPQTATQLSPQHRSRAMSNASTIVPSHHSQHSPGSQLDVNSNMELRELMGAQRSRRGSSRTSNGSVGPRSPGTASLPEEAEKSSVQCKDCGRIFTGKAAWLPSNLQRHMRETHLNAPKTQCRICGKDFARGHNLRHHMKAVHGEQP